ncbi:hypothetical protein IV203_032321 [Nitzschia inconspicua]|uniref:Uncharacterized protein n=1 Tax=Nitzschia inconspicua TaxID=303405 RepID=A0A9K3KKH5_9STRA|nr:hypothetical protein IV203_032321 [Nitzschia inconspicua]
MPLHEPILGQVSQLRECFTVRERLDLLPDPELEAALESPRGVPDVDVEAIADTVGESEPTFNRNGIAYPMLVCKKCTFHNAEVQLYIGNSSYQGRIQRPRPWWESAYIASFAAMLAHVVHHPCFLYVHCQIPTTNVTREEVHPYPKGKNVRTGMIGLDVTPQYGAKSDYAAQLYVKVDGKHEWSVKSTSLVSQMDDYNCGPIACLKLWTLFQPGEVDSPKLDVKDYRAAVVSKCNQLFKKVEGGLVWNKRRVVVDKDVVEWALYERAPEDFSRKRTSREEEQESGPSTGDVERDKRRRVSKGKRFL